jgi:hypothetical protein
MQATDGIAGHQDLMVKACHFGLCKLCNDLQCCKSIATNVHVSRGLQLTEFIYTTIITVKRINVRDFTEHSSVLHGHGSQSALPSKALQYLHSLV